jgi:predicted Rossmann fold flavoprotein
MDLDCDIAVVGTGAAGLMAAIWAGRAAAGMGRPLRVVAIDGARTLGAKILVAGGGRCNVTHFRVDETAFAGSTPGAIRKVLRRFDVAKTTALFAELGVELKREETGKLFPVTDDASTVLGALLDEAGRLGIDLRHPWRVHAVQREAEGFVIHGSPGGTTRQAVAPELPRGGLSSAEALRARRVVLATGGMALPRSGSDGQGYVIARALGHSITGRIFPALVPLTLAEGSFIRGLSGLTLPTTVSVHSGTGKKLATFTNSTLCTHFGLSGPSVLDVSRYLLDARHTEPAATLRINWTPGQTIETLDAILVAQRGISPGRLLSGAPLSLPDRLTRALCDHAGVDPSATTEHLTRQRRRALASAVTEMVVPVTGDRGFTHAEVTAGGIPLAEIDLDTMESRVCPGLFLCGEICDVDGRIGGFNFQWAWASGHVAGTAAAAAEVGMKA